ncbi:hypothetical protein ACQ4M4_12995 [Leptolyngbya sp. AN02str]|uniref:hypothetical protein n=1 Tax=Leptolyngbya sp. AN02str TaxID=3423363 RepID=UPI003D31862D
MAKNAVIEAIAVEAAPEALNTVIVLPGGQVAVEQELSGADYWEFLKIASKNAAEATRWLMLRAYVVNGEALTIDQLEDEDGIGFEGAAVLSSEVAKLFAPEGEVVESGIALPGGKVAVKQKLPGRKFFEFQRMAGEDAIAATRWVMTQLFEVDGAALTEAMLTADGLGFKGVALLNQEINKLFKAALAHKK